ncbi:telomere regulation protein Stn1-domain-containing protein [Scheffersomyces xylosifermentans]|uniref:telomere regulation protein Stn1-domain-containing protein n=1 Tax=Scheffersomyces xylosifermentans TaxID=1304137 RepID=UPI00315D1C28
MYQKPRVDFGPGENHIVLRTPTKCFYVPELFHLAPTSQSAVPIFIRDILRSRSAVSIYGKMGEYFKNTVIVNNYPVYKVKVFGRIIGERYWDFGTGTQTDSRNFVLVTIDDSSSSKKSSIGVKITEEKYLGLGLSFGNNYGKLLEVEGTLDFYFGAQVRPTQVKLISDVRDIEQEIKFWGQTMSYRKDVLETAWQFTPSITNGSQMRLPFTFDGNEQYKRDARHSLQLSLGVFELPDLVRDDSILVTKRKQARSSNSKPEVDFIDLVEDDESLEEDDEILVEAIQEVKEVSEQTDPPTNNQILQPSISAHIVDITDNEDSNSSDVEIIEVNERPIHVVTEFQLMLEFIKFIVNCRFAKFKLIQLYNDATIRELLDNLTRLQLASYNLQCFPSSGDDDFTSLRDKLFHRIRHELHQLNLVAVTTSQNVKSRNLQLVFEDLQKRLLAIKASLLAQPHKQEVLDVQSYILYLNQSSHMAEGASYKLFNGLIDYIITDCFHERANWRYDPRLIQWTYSTE